jgi:hypothetical protein
MRHPPPTIRRNVLTVGAIAVTAAPEMCIRNGGGDRKWSRR